MRNRWIPATVCTVLCAAGLGLLFVGVRDYRWSSQEWRSALAPTDPTPDADSGEPPFEAVAVFASPRRLDVELDGRAFSTDTPFLIQIDATGVVAQEADVDRLRIDAEGESELVDLLPGTLLELGKERYTVVDVRPWAGLLRDGHGIHMAAVSLESDEGTAHEFFLKAGKLTRSDGGPALYFDWCSDEAEARRRTKDGLEESAFARWGAADGAAVHWFTSLLPGTGVERSDGSIVTLVAFTKEAATTAEGPRVSIEVQIQNDGQTERVRLDGPSDVGPIYFEYPVLFGGMVTVYSWRDDMALVAFQVGGHTLGPVSLESGEAWRPAGADFTVRLEQALASAVPVTRERSPLFEVVLQGPARRVRVRQGEAVRVGDALLRFVRSVPVERVEYELTLIHASGGEEHFRLGPGEDYAFETPLGRYRLRYEDIRPDESITLRPVSPRVPPGLVAGFVLALLGAAGALRFFGRSR